MSYRSIARLFLAIGLITLVAAGAEAAPITVVNNSFESGTFVNDGNGTDILAVGSTAMTGWTVVVDQLAWIISPNPWGLSAQDGNAFLDFTAYPAGAPFGGVEQTLTTVAGNLYQVDYYLGTYTVRWGPPPPAPVTILASAAGTSAPCSVNTPSAASTWTLCTMNFVATGTSSTLRFAGTAGFLYIGLDNVSVNDLGPTTQPVPEPASMFLLGTGLLGLAARRRH